MAKHVIGRGFNSVTKLATPIVNIFRAIGNYPAAVLYNIFSEEKTWNSMYTGLDILMVIALVVTLLTKTERLLH